MTSFLINCLIVLVLGWTARVIYSLYFSQLKDIPSPLIFQVFPIYYRLLRAKGTAPEVIHEYHKTLGPIFRVGWSLVLCVDMEATRAIYGSYACDRAAIYEGFGYFGQTVLTMRTKDDHVRRKRLLAPAFSKGRVAAMEPAIVNVGLNPLIKNIQDAVKSGQPLDIYHQLHYMAWDVIGDLVFGESFKMLENGNHSLVDWINHLSVWSMLCYMFPILRRVRLSSGEKVRQFSTFLLNRFYLKLDTKQEVTENILSHLVNSVDSATGEQLNKEQIFSEAVLMLHAGTDTTSNSLTWFFYLLMSNPKCQQNIFMEMQLAGFLGTQKTISSQQFTEHLPYLTACLKEAMRLLPAASGMPLRVVPEGGLNIMGYHLSAGTEISVPIYSLHRSPFLWKNSDSFIPERWLSPSPELQNYIPFLLGPRACIGKHLAWLKLSLISANLLARYSFELPDPDLAIPMISTPVLRPKLGQLMVNISTHL